ncbi:class I SAM-dependent methyltransferase [Dactylosporangium vinaceum]|uniref:Class I SAM-dependent methyltransferase n=1 Tax=Dactylosporangium vinaceum TaxID=53362 RepID=A0ABV5ME40_9ACTN|nr:class I SAM-dependent methyltransferase [Dactylosporangium vinaceum]UAB92522.1 class I SAM-dependent methyltransferase [Dactylosporangium vinaceum]
MSELGRLTAVDAAALQESWDRQQESYMPDREQRFAAMLDAVAATAGAGTVRLLDLAGGTGSITLRALRRFPDLVATVVDLDPALLAIADGSLAGRAAIVTADLSRPGWQAELPLGEYDAVLTATALHWLPGERISVLYDEIRGLLRPGGIFVNVDHIPDEGLPTLTKQLVAAGETVRSARYTAGATLSWSQWWERLAAIPALAPLVARRHEIYPSGHAAEYTPAADWHLDALRAAGYTEVGVLWRGGPDAAVVGVR